MPTLLPCERRPSQVVLEGLEPRLLLAGATPSGYDQYLLELINRGRANPSAEAKRYNIALNEHLPANTISKTAKQPLAFNTRLVYAARTHSQWMLNNDVFDHYEQPGNVGPGTRITNAGYVYTMYGENIAWSGTTGTPDVNAYIAQIHRNLFRDTNEPTRGHRVNQMKDAYKEIGLGVVTGAFTGYNSVMVTEDFAAAGGNSFLTGVAYADNKVHDSFYTPGEGLGKVSIQAVRQSDNATYTTKTWGAGGYSLRLPPGTYQVRASGGGLTAPITKTVTISSKNIKRDFVKQGGKAGLPEAAYLKATPLDGGSGAAVIFAGPGELPKLGRACHGVALASRATEASQADQPMLVLGGRSDNADGAGLLQRQALPRAGELGTMGAGRTLPAMVLPAGRQSGVFSSPALAVEWVCFARGIGFVG